MRGVVKLVTVAALLAASVAVSDAANETQRCDKAKTAAIARLFKDSIQCNHRAQFDLAFDLTGCRTNAYNRCTSAITRADAAFGAACFYTANYNVCADTLNSANTIYPNV